MAHKVYRAITGQTSQEDVRTTGWSAPQFQDAYLTDAQSYQGQGYDAATQQYQAGDQFQNVLGQAMDASQQFLDPTSQWAMTQQNILSEQAGQQAAQAQAQQNQMLAQRGVGSGGLRNILGAQAQQQAGATLRQGSADIATRGAGLGLQAMGQAGQMAGQMEGYGLQQAMANQAAQNQASQFGAQAANQAAQFNAQQAAQNAQFNASNQMNWDSWNASQAFAAQQFNNSQRNAVTMGNRANQAGFWSNVLSDENLKENIKFIDKSPSGVNIYEFEYKDKNHGKGKYTGVLAQELIGTDYKDAVSRHMDGHLVVNYDKLDVNFRRVR